MDREASRAVFTVDSSRVSRFLQAQERAKETEANIEDQEEGDRSWHSDLP